MAGVDPRIDHRDIDPGPVVAIIVEGQHIQLCQIRVVAVFRAIDPLRRIAVIAHGQRSLRQASPGPGDLIRLAQGQGANNRQPKAGHSSIAHHSVKAGGKRHSHRRLSRHRPRCGLQPDARLKALSRGAERNNRRRGNEGENIGGCKTKHQKSNIKIIFRHSLTRDKISL